MKNIKLVLIIFAILGTITVLVFGFGYMDVLMTKTVGKAKQNAKREVFEQTQSYVEGKRQSALKYYQEYLKATPEQQMSLKGIISQDFANFDEDEYLKGDLLIFIRKCKYN